MFNAYLYHHFGMGRKGRLRDMWHSTRDPIHDVVLDMRPSSRRPAQCMFQFLYLFFVSARRHDAFDGIS